MGETGAGSTEQTAITEMGYRLQRQVKSGADWFFWIVGLSIINSLALALGGKWSFLIGLGSTQFVDGFINALAVEFGPPIQTIIRILGLVISVIIAGVFALFGLLARKGHKWSFIVGMMLYALDGIIFLLVGDLASLGFHLFALFWISVGLRAKIQLDKVERGEADVLASAQKPMFTKEPRPRAYWIKLGLVAGIVLVPLLIFLVLFLFFLR